MYTLVPFRGRRELSHANDMMNGMLNDRFFRSFFDMSDWMGNAGFRVDVKEQPDAYQLEAELPGVREDQIDLTVDNDVLTISANLNTEKKEEKDNYLYSERRSGHMERSFNLEGISQEGISAKFENGVLFITLPKEKPQPQRSARRIAIGGVDKADN